MAAVWPSEFFALFESASSLFFFFFPEERDRLLLARGNFMKLPTQAPDF